jgi:tetratricopeptide (TPR) repeat protein
MGVTVRVQLCAVVLLCACSIPVQTQQSEPGQLEHLAQEGERALAAGRYAEAERAYEHLRDLQPTVGAVHGRLGLIYYQQGKFAEAVPTLRKALKLAPGLPNADILLAMSLSEIGTYDEALPGLQKGFRQSRDVALKRMAGLHLQRAYTGLKRDSDAVGVALELSRVYPKDPEILYHTGRVFANFAYLQTMKLAEVAPDSVWLHQAAGEANESQSLYDAAIKEYRQVLAIAPNRPGMHFRIGRALLSRARQAQGDATSENQAAQEFAQELQIDPTNANAAYELGELHRKRAQFDEAIELFQMAVKADPEFEEALVGLGRTLTAVGKPADALPLLKTATALDPTDDVAYYQLALAFRGVGNEAEQRTALAEFQRLRDRKKAREAAMLGPAVSDVTKQEIEPQQPQ